MADIDIVPRRRTSVWLWIALAIVALAVIFFLLAMAGDPQRVASALGAPGNATAIAAAPAAAALT